MGLKRSGVALWVYRGPEWLYGSKEVRSGFMGLKRSGVGYLVSN